MLQTCYITNIDNRGKAAATEMQTLHKIDPVYLLSLCADSTILVCKSQEAKTVAIQAIIKAMMRNHKIMRFYIDGNAFMVLVDPSVPVQQHAA